MTDRPITFSAPMIRALLDGRKTQTRRMLRPQPLARDVRPNGFSGVAFSFTLCDDGGANSTMAVPVGYQVGDRLWVKEAWNAFTFSEDGECAWPTKTIPTADEMREAREAAYRFDVQVVYRESDRARKWFTDQPWRSPIHMPKWASRLTLIVTDVRVQRVQDTSEADARAEGCPTGAEGPTVQIGPGVEHIYEDACEWFADLWDTLHGSDAWDRNDWVCALTFDVHRENIGEMPND